MTGPIKITPSSTRSNDNNDDANLNGRTDHHTSGGAVPELPGSMVRYTHLADHSSLPTIFPTPVAQLITSIATSTRVSLRMSAFLIEAVLESSQYSTKMSLNYTRRILITAISTARRIYLMSKPALDWDMMQQIGYGSVIENGKASTSALGHTTAPHDPFLSVLDKYTNLGIYLIHHTFTMAELFAMSGFFLTATALQSFHQAAHDSVALFDSLFGSNESSRTLSAIISMVRKEVLLDERCKDKSTIASLTGLTKAMTAFACLQAATWQRTSKRLKMKVLYDCTVLAERSDTLTASTSTQPQGDPRSLSIAALDEPQALAGPGPTTAETRQRQTSVQHGFHPSLEEANQRLQAHVQATTSGRSDRAVEDWQRQQQVADSDDRSSWSMDELDELVGESGDELYDGPPSKTARELHRQQRRREARLEITDELTESTIVTQMLERVHPDGRRYRSSPLHNRQLSLDNICMLPDQNGSECFDESTSSSNMTSPRPDSILSRLADEEENDWIEVDHILNEDEEVIPSVPNGGNSVGSASYRDALEHPQHNAERIQLVLKTMTNKLLQRKRTVRHLTRVNKSETSDSDGTIVPIVASNRRLTGSRRNVRDVDWDLTPRPSSERLRRLPLKSETSDFSGSPGIGKRASSAVFPSPPPQAGSPSTPSPFDKAWSKGKNVLSRSGRGSGDSGQATRTGTRDTSPMAGPSRRRRTAPVPVDIDPEYGEKRMREGSRAPPPSPLNSMVLRTPSISNVEHGQQSEHRAVSHQYSKTAPPDGASFRSQNSRPSLATLREAVHTSSSRIQSASSQLVPEKGDVSSDTLFPHEGLIRNIHRFMRYSSAAYGQNFLRILGLGSSDFMFPSTGKHHANSWAFAQHTGIPIDCLLLSSFAVSSATLIQQEAPPLVHYVAVAHDLKAIVLTCRGTLGLSDVLVDLTCEYQSIHVDRGDPDAAYYVHAGMWQSARKLSVKQSTVHQTLVDALTKYPTYGLVLAGHSLGGGVAALLAILSSMPSEAFLEHNLALPSRSQVKHPSISTPFVTNFASGLPPGRPIHCYAYGPPAVTSPDLASYASGLITSIVQDSDVVPTLSLGAVKDFKNVALTLSEEGNVAEEIVGRVIGIYKRKFDFQKSSSHSGPSTTTSSSFGLGRTSGVGAGAPSDEEALNDWMISLIKTMRADMDNEKLFPPGMVYIMEHFDVFVNDDVLSPPEHVIPAFGKRVIQKQAHRVILRQCDSVEERFREPVFAKSMLQNHLPSQYERSTGLLFEGLGQGKL